MWMRLLIPVMPPVGMRQLIPGLSLVRMKQMASVWLLQENLTLMLYVVMILQRQMSQAVAMEWRQMGMPLLLLSRRHINRKGLLQKF